MAISLCGLGVADYTQNLPGAVISTLCIMVAFSFMGGFWVLVGEVFTLGTKVIAAPVATATLFGIGAISDLLFSIMIDVLSWKTYFVFASFALMGGLHMHIMLPETKGKKLVDVRKMFKNYTCGYGCRSHLCCCLFKHVIDNGKRLTKKEVVDAKRKSNKLQSGNHSDESLSDSDSSNERDEFSDVKSDIATAAVVAQVVSESEDNDAISLVAINPIDDEEHHEVDV
jgi:hypothetical protein